MYSLGGVICTTSAWPCCALCKHLCGVFHCICGAANFETYGDELRRQL